MVLRMEVVVGVHLVFVSARPRMCVWMLFVSSNMDGMSCHELLCRVWAFWNVMQRMLEDGGVRGSPQWGLTMEVGQDGCVGSRGWVVGSDVASGEGYDVMVLILAMGGAQIRYGRFWEGG